MEVLPRPAAYDIWQATRMNGDCDCYCTKSTQVFQYIAGVIELIISYREGTQTNVTPEATAIETFLAAQAEDFVGHENRLYI
jgi:hypothetical protein